MVVCIQKYWEIIYEVWVDENKNRENIRKHGVAFEEAKTIFVNDFIEKPDIDHSEDESRFIAIGIS